jgi:hypothetical protein
MGRQWQDEDGYTIYIYIKTNEEHVYGPSHPGRISSDWACSLIYVPNRPNYFPVGILLP